MSPHPVDRVRLVFEHLRPEGLQDTLATIYAPDARFKDPFQEVQGVAGVAHVFEHMFRTLDAPRFVVIEQLAQGQQALLTWDFHFRFKGNPSAQRIHGASHLRFDEAGRITVHRDYWDAAEELYEKLPLLGRLMRWLRRRVQA